MAQNVRFLARKWLKMGHFWLKYGILLSVTDRRILAKISVRRSVIPTYPGYPLSWISVLETLDSTTILLHNYFEACIKIAILKGEILHPSLTRA